MRHATTNPVMHVCVRTHAWVRASIFERHPDTHISMYANMCLHHVHHIHNMYQISIIFLSSCVNRIHPLCSSRLSCADSLGKHNHVWIPLTSIMYICDSHSIIKIWCIIEREIRMSNTFTNMHTSTLYMHVFMYEHARTLSLSPASAPSDSSFATALSSPFSLA